MSLPDICIFSQPVRSGKTTALQRWLHRQSNVAGILTPDIDDRRTIYDIAAKQYDVFQVGTEVAESEVLSIGKYRFLLQAFHKANALLETALLHSYDWLIIDEVGKLEVYENKGFEPALSKVIAHYQQAGSHGRLLLVVRDYLLNDVMNKYNLKEDMVLPENFFS